jgi:hypothetical protein
MKPVSLFVFVLGCWAYSFCGGCVVDARDPGDRIESCRAGDTCTCDGVGSCNFACTGAGCHFRCDGVTSCSFDCAGGGCDMQCNGISDCDLTCPAGGCAASCNGPGHCSVR